jgi:hypothetical protein
MGRVRDFSPARACETVGFIMTMRTKLLTGGAVLAVAGVAALSLVSFVSLRNEVNRTSDVVYWTAVKDSADAALVGSYLERYPDGMFARLALARMDELKKGATQVADAGKAAGEMKAKAEAEAARILAAAKAEADKAAAAAKAEMAKAEQAKSEAEKQAKLAADKAAADRVAAEKAMAEAKAAADKQTQAAAAATAAAETARARAQQQAAAPAPGAAASAGAAFVVISSTADGLKKGDRVAPSQAISVPTGTRVVLMDGAGKVMTVRGPFNGTPGTGESSGVIGRLSQALTQSADAPRRVGAFRGVGGSRLGGGLASGGGMVDPWAIDTAQSGNWCVAAERGVTLTGGPQGLDSATVEMLPSGPKSDVPWPKSQASVQWPASVPVKSGATYQIRYGATTTSVTLHILERKTASPGQVALWMAEKGCSTQAAAMIDSLERGVAGRLFDVEIGGDRAQGRYRIGEELKLSVRPSRDAYLYCFYKDVAGEVTKIFPSQYDTTARVGAGAQPIPAPTWEAPMQLTGPAGQAEVRCFAVDKDASAQLPPEIGKPGFTVLPATVAASLMDVFKRVPEGSVATAAMPIQVTE